MQHLENVTKSEQQRALWASTIAFTGCFAVWTIFSIIGIQIKADLGLNETQFGLLVATPILTGSISRIFLGIWTDQFGGRRVFACVMFFAAIAAWLLSTVSTYPMFLLAALGVGLAGGSFAVGIAYTSKWFDSDHQGTALGIFGMGNVGAAITNFGAPFILVAVGWERTAQIYAMVLMAMAVIFFFSTKEDPAIRARRASGQKPRSALMELEPLRNLQVWRFALYYFFRVSALLSRLPCGCRGTSSEFMASILKPPACSLRFTQFRPVSSAPMADYLSDKIGARKVMYWTFAISIIACFMLSYPHTDYVIHGIEGPIMFSTQMGLVPFVILIFILGFFMSLGKAAVYKHIPVYYPWPCWRSVGGLVGMIGGLGGFILPILFGVMNDLTGIWTSCFMLLFLHCRRCSLAWMHFAIRRMEDQSTWARELEALCRNFRRCRRSIPRSGVRRR